MLTIILAVLGSSALSSVFVACLNRHWQNQDRKDNVLTKDDVRPIKEKIDCLVDNQRIICIDKILVMGRKYIKQGYIDLEDKANLERLYHSAKTLDMNGDTDVVMHEIEKLEVR